jgi:hypothetical protein
LYRYLLDHGADRNILTDDSERPYDLIEPDDMETIRVMLGHRSMSAIESGDDAEGGYSDGEVMMLWMRKLKNLHECVLVAGCCGVVWIEGAQGNHVTSWKRMKMRRRKRIKARDLWAIIGTIANKNYHR